MIQFSYIAALLLILTLCNETANAKVWDNNPSYRFNFSVQRNTTTSFQLQEPHLRDAFSWTHSLNDKHGNQLPDIPSFCTSTGASLSYSQDFCLQAPQSPQNYSAITYFATNLSKSYQVTFFLTDISREKLQIFTLTSKAEGNGYRTSHNVTTMPYVNNGDFTPIVVTTTTSGNQAVSTSNLHSHHLFNINNEFLLLEINCQVKIFAYTVGGGLTQTTFYNLRTPNANAIVYASNLLFVASNYILVYNVSQATAASIPLIQNITSETFPSRPSAINIISMDVDPARQILYVMDSALGIYAINITSAPVTIENIGTLRTSLETQQMKKLKVGMEGILLVETNQNGQTVLFEIAADSQNIFNASYNVLNSHKDLPSIFHLETYKNLGVYTSQNIIQSFRQGIPMVASSSSTLKEASLSFLNSLIAVPFDFGDSRIKVFSVSRYSICLNELVIGLPTLTCSPPKNLTTGTYDLNSAILTPNCQQKEANLDVSPLSSCQINGSIQVEVWDALIPSGNIGLIVGLAIGLFFFAIAIGLGVCYCKKAKTYERLRGEAAQGSMREKDIELKFGN